MGALVAPPGPVKRLTAVVAAVLLIVGLLTACTAPSSQIVRAGSASVSAGTPTTLQVPHGGPTVSLPAQAVKGTGELTVTRATSNDLLGWTIGLHGGAQLVGTATLSFPVVAGKDAPPPLVGYNEHLSDPITLVHGTLTDGRYVVRTNHFSNWFTDILDHLKEKVTAWAAETFAEVKSPTVPSCSGWPALSAAGYTSEATTTRLVNACLGAASEAPQVKIASRLGSPLVVETRAGLRAQTSSTSLDNAFPKLLSQLQATKAKGDTMHFLAAKDTMVLDATKGTRTGLNITPSGAGYLASVLILAAKLVSQLSGFAGETKTAQNMMTALDGEKCMGPVIAQAVGKNVTSATELANYAIDLVRPVFDCAATFMKDSFKGFLAGEVLGWFEWIAEAVQSVAAGAVGALATILEPNGATIAITPPGGTANTVAPKNSASSGGKWYYLSDMNRVGWGPYGSANGPATLAGKPYLHSVTLFVPDDPAYPDKEYLEYNLGYHCSRLQATAGITDDSNVSGAADSTVRLDGRLVGTYTTTTGHVQSVDVNTTGAFRLKIGSQWQQPQPAAVVPRNVGWGNARVLCSTNPAPPNN